MMEIIISLLGNIPAILATIAAGLALIWGNGRINRHKGRKEGAQSVRDQAKAEADKRKEQRNEIDANNDADSARDSLRSDWSD